MRRGPDRRRASFSTSSRGFPPPRPTLILGFEKLLPPARSTNTLPTSFRPAATNSPPGPRPAGAVSLYGPPAAGAASRDSFCATASGPAASRTSSRWRPLSLPLVGWRGTLWFSPAFSLCPFSQPSGPRSTIESCGAEWHGPLGGCGGK